MLVDLLNFVKEQFTKRNECKVCIAKDYLIATLREELYFERNRTNDLINKITEPKVVVERQVVGDNQVHSIRQGRGIQARIQKAEREDFAKATEDGIVAKRDREYKDRIDTLIKETTTEEGKEVN